MQSLVRELRPKASIAIVCVLALGTAGILPTSAGSHGSFDQSWQSPGQTFRYAAILGGTPEFTFTVVVHDVTSTEIGLSWVAGSSGSELVQQATFSRSTRESVDNAGHFSYIFINDADLHNGGAFIGDDFAILVSSGASHQFTSGPLNFYFSAATGVLVHAENLETGSVITLDASFAGSIPTADNEEDEYFLKAVPAGEDFSSSASGGSDGPGTQSHPPQRIRMRCEGSVGFVLGGNQNCQVNWRFIDRGIFHPPSSFTIDYVDIGWPYLGSGTMSIRWIDSLGEYLRVMCFSPMPATSAGSVHCDAVLLRTVVTTGTHNWVTSVSFEYCLNPFTLFSCPYFAETQHTGDVACITGAPRCVRIF